MFDRRLRPLKELKGTGWKKITDTAWRPDETVVTDLQRKHQTVVFPSG